MEDLRFIFVRTRLKNPSFEGPDKEDVGTSLRAVLVVLIEEERAYGIGVETSLRAVLIVLIEEERAYVGIGVETSLRLVLIDLIEEE